VKFLLDTNACVSHLRGTQPTITSKLNAALTGDIVLCSVVKAELIFGALRSNRPHENLQRLGVFFSGLASLPFDDASAEQYATIRSALAIAGTPIGPNDLMIASIAVANGVTLITHNVSEFGRVAGWNIEDWQV
jgi:tRNA(fMet)-specific endonuclease VapC